MKLLELEGKLREFAKTRSIRLAYEICDGLIEDFNGADDEKAEK